ncbi:MAG: hypothetical protein ABSD13_12345 [Candidatus Korobacteraceae bacterium]|jgi:16S rRNA U1498 N3-methylase RsmE
MSDQRIHLIPTPASGKASKTPAEIEQLEELKKLERVADEAAEQAGKREQKYDNDHNIFTK